MRQERQNSVRGLSLVFTLPLIALGCAPSITSITPSTADRLQPIKIKGDNLLLATVSIDGGNLGTWFVAGENPDTTKGSVIPAKQTDGTTLTMAAASVKACNTWGCDTEIVNITAGPASGSTPTIDIAPPFNTFECNFFGTPAECITVTGSDLYPGESSPLRPHAGPNARAIPQGSGALTNALGSEMLAENAVLVFFPDTMPSGSYKVEITNIARFGGPGGITGSNFTR